MQHGTFKLNREAASNALASPDTFAFVLMTIALMTLEDAFEMESAVLFSELEEEYNCTIPEENENKINAAITAMRTDLFETCVPVFKAITLAFNEGDIGGIPDGGDEEDPSVPELLWAIIENGLLNGKDDVVTMDDFETPVITYTQNIIQNEACDLEMIDDEVDEVDEALDLPYYQLLIANNTSHLIAQLGVLGVPIAILDELRETLYGISD